MPGFFIVRFDPGTVLLVGPKNAVRTSPSASTKSSCHWPITVRPAASFFYGDEWSFTDRAA